MSKRKRATLIVLLIVVLVGACFGTVAVYAKREFNKPVFEIPEQEPVASAAQLPSEIAALCGYVSEVYESTVTADNVEASWHTEINLDGEFSTSFSEADQNIFAFAKDNAAGEIASFYPSAESERVVESKNLPEINVDPAFVAEFTAEQGLKNDDEDFYYVSFTLDPSALDVSGITDEEVYGKTVEKISSAFTVDSAEFTPVRYEMKFKIDRISNCALSAEITRGYDVKLSVTPAGDFASSASDNGSAEISLPFTATQKISFTEFGARFTTRAIAVQKNDMKALPADIKVDSEASKEDYELTFDVSKDGVVSIDEDGVMTVEENCDEPVVITMTLKYEGHTYSDKLTVYITELEVASNV